MNDSNTNVLVTYFDSLAAAEAAAEAIRNWDKATKEIQLGAVGVMYKDADGEVQTQLARRTGDGVKVGAMLGAAVGLFSRKRSILGSALTGAAVGGVAGHFMKVSLGLSDEEAAEIGRHLDHGEAVVVVTCDDGEVVETKGFLSGQGGKTTVYRGLTADETTMKELADSIVVSDEGGQAAA